MPKFIKAKIEIELCLLSHMHIGSSEEFILGMPCKNKPKQQENVNLLALNSQGTPYIPAATIKGTLRSLYGKQFNNNESLYFGQASSDCKQSAVTVFNAAILNVDDDSLQFFTERTQVAIDPVTRTGIENHLFTKQWVKPGVKFKSEISFEHISSDDFNLFVNFIKQANVQLGAGQSIGSGKVEINLLSCSVLTKQQLQNWLASKKDISHSFLPHDVEEKVLLKGENTLTLGVKLLPLSPFITNSSQQTKQHEQKANIDERTFDQYTIINHQGKPYIPGSSLKGVLRHYFSKIASTITTGSSSSLIEHIFGNTDAQGYVVISDAISSEGINSCKHEQSLIAIDRFTGGVEQGALLDIQACYPENFTFELSLNKQKITSLDALLWSFTLRDLMAGNIYFGAHSSSGFGKMTANIEIGQQSFCSFEQMLPVFLDILAITQEDLQNVEKELQGVCHD